MAQITGGGDSLDDCRDLLEKLRENLQQSLSGDSFDFNMLLPGDDCELSERTESLAHWCQGFLFGLTVGGIEAGQALPGDTAEVVSDFAQLAEAEHVGEATEKDEWNYVELCEYVRAGTQLAYEEFAIQRNQAESNNPIS